jgi:mycobactin salicyl-AMP ligase
MDGFVPFPADRAARYQADGYWTGRSLDSLLTIAAQRRPTHAGVVDAESTLTFAELDERATRAAAGLAALGIAAGDRVLLQFPNGCEFAVALFGLLRVGAIPVMCLAGHRAAELRHFAAVSDAKALLIPATAAGFDYVQMALQLTAENAGLRHVIVDGNAGPFVAWPQVCTSMADLPQHQPDPTSPALLLVSGGTTGLPKLIPRTHNDYVYNATASAQVCELTAEDVYLAALPAAHNFPLCCPGLLGAISVGATTVFLTNPSPESAFAAIARHGVTVTALVPALANLWAQATEWEPEAPTSLRLLQVGGAKLEAVDAQRVRETLTPGLQQVFGMAEGLLNYTRPGDPTAVVDHTQGRPLCADDEIRIVDEAGQPVPVGTEGELLVRGPYTFNGYFCAEEANATSFDPQGFYRSGDLVRQNKDGYLEVTGRVKDVIHRGGETIAAADLEEHLRTHPAISSVAAVALPDSYLGEKICAAVVFAGTPVTLTELNAYLDQRGVARHARPDALSAMASLPTTPVGKVDKKAIVRQLQS